MNRFMLVLFGGVEEMTPELQKRVYKESNKKVRN